VALAKVENALPPHGPTLHQQGIATDDRWSAVVFAWLSLIPGLSPIHRSCDIGLIARLKVMWVNDRRRPGATVAPMNLAELPRVFEKAKTLKQQRRSPQQIRNELAVESLTAREGARGMKD
jgi:hypothetical protein